MNIDVNNLAAITRDELLQIIRAAPIVSPKVYLTEMDLARHMGVSINRLRKLVRKHFDTWRQACETCGVQPGEASPKNIKPNYGPTSDECIQEIRRIAILLGRSDLSRKDLKAHGKWGAKPYYRHFGTWIAALSLAGCKPVDSYNEPIEFAVLAQEYLKATLELGRPPSLIQMKRRSNFGEGTITRKYNGYLGFKVLASRHILTSGVVLPPDIQISLKNIVESATPSLTADNVVPAPHHHGRSLGFRAFPYAPTYENEVVSLFAAIADELGFEILCNRVAFPDCEARRVIPGRRKRFENCLIEFEVTSIDFKKHGHNPEGCDLIVCWEHNWPDCPIAVLELKEAIRSLPGWK